MADRNVEAMTPLLNAIGLTAADMATTLDFYRRLGLDIPAGADTETHVEAVVPGGIRLMWDTVELLTSLDPEFSAPTGEGPSLAFLCADAAEVDSVHADMVKAGYTSSKEPWDAVWRQRYAVLKDPDGNQVDLFAWVTPAQ
jgi:catechol 2,3-dioxygenase-like lactoylglutathione lyase family enzyme